MIAVSVFFLLATLSLCKCYNVKVHEVLLKNNIENIIHGYVKPLSERFPNHEVEVQVDYQGRQPTKRNSKKRMYVYQRPFHLRTGDETQSTIALATNPVPTVATVTTTTQKPSEPPTKADTRKPVYMEDLKRALADFEKKLNSNVNSNRVAEIGGDSYMEAEEQQDPKIVISNSDPIHDHNIERIIDLLRKGIYSQKSVQKPLDDNLEWMQIKIPKNK